MGEPAALYKVDYAVIGCEVLLVIYCSSLISMHPEVPLKPRYPQMGELAALYKVEYAFAALGSAIWNMC
jgi:hypothetical protein